MQVAMCLGVLLPCLAWAQAPGNERLLLDYMRQRIVVHCVQEGVPRTRLKWKGGSVLTLSEVRAFLNGVPGIYSASPPKLVDSSPPSTLHGWHLRNRGAAVGFGDMDISTASPVLYCVLASGKIYELANEHGFQRDAADEWIRKKGKVNVATKLKIIADAYARSRHTIIMGYVNGAADFGALKQIIPQDSEPEMQTARQWFELEQEYYKRGLYGGEGVVHCVIGYPCVCLNRARIKRVVVSIEQEDPSSPGEWKEMLAAPGRNGVPLEGDESIRAPLFQMESSKTVSKSNEWFHKKHSRDELMRRWPGLSTKGYVAAVATVAGVKCYDVTSEKLINSDILMLMRPYTILCCENKRGELMRLNVQPLCWQPCSFQVIKSAPSLKVFRTFLKRAGLDENALSRRQLSELYIKVICHNWPGEFPTILLTSDDITPRLSELSPAQKKYGCLLDNDCKKVGDYIVLAEFPVSNNVARFCFTFTKENRITSVYMKTVQ
ncbi:MAG: hypothetical protein P8Z49_08800 [Acidobacteriota bacterium]